MKILQTILAISFLFGSDFAFGHCAGGLSHTDESIFHRFADRATDIFSDACEGENSSDLKGESSGDLKSVCKTFEVCVEHLHNRQREKGQKNLALAVIACQRSLPPVPLKEGACNVAFEVCMNKFIDRVGLKTAANNFKYYEDRCSNFVIETLGMEQCNEKMGYIRCIHPGFLH